MIWTDQGALLARVLRTHASDAEVFGGSEDVGVDFNPWNTVQAGRPLARIECRTAEHVATALRVAVDHGTPVSVCGGREDAHGRNSRSGFLVIDLRRMDAISYDGGSGSVEVGGGVTAGSLLAVLPPERVTPTTANANVGLVGAAAGGGYGMLAGRHGLVCDALLGADVVTPDGIKRTVDANTSADLFWALRGGGSGFGVVVSARFATYVLPSVLNAQIQFSLSSARPALAAVDSLLEEHGERLGLLPLFMRATDKQAVLLVSFVWHGPEAEGRQALQRLSGLPGAQLASADLVPYRDTLEHGEIWPWGRAWRFGTQTFRRLSGEVADRLVEGAATMPLPGCILFLHNCHGYATRVALAQTAFPMRAGHYVAGWLGWAEPGDRAGNTALRDWVAALDERLAPLATPGGYVNFLAPVETGRVCLSYGETVKRLQAIKRGVDPHDLLRAATGRLEQPM